MTVSFVGSGNVATHMAKAFYNAGFDILEICSSTAENAQLLASQVNADFLTNLSHLKPVDLLIISIKDDEIEKVLSEILLKDSLVVHTSGATALSILSGKFNNYGVFYPLQTFSKNTLVNFSEVPLCIEGCDFETTNKLLKIANTLSASVTEVNSNDRKQLHLAAVFTCNFTNHLFVIGSKILEKQNLPFQLLIPLITETVNKIKVANPEDVQTGPAIRNDKKVMESHLALLNGNPEWQEIYVLLSKSIKNQHSL